MVVDFKWNLNSGSPNTWNPGKWPPFFKNHLKSRQKCRDFQWSTFHKVAKTKADLLKSRSFQIQPSKSPDFKYFPILNGWISDPGCILLLWRKLKKRFRLFVILCRFVQPWTERWRDANLHSRANTTTWSTRYFYNMVNQVFWLPDRIKVAYSGGIPNARKPNPFENRTFENRTSKWPL